MFSNYSLYLLQGRNNSKGFCLRQGLTTPPCWPNHTGRATYLPLPPKAPHLANSKFLKLSTFYSPKLFLFFLILLRSPSKYQTDAGKFILSTKTKQTAKGGFQSQHLNYETKATITKSSHTL